MAISTDHYTVSLIGAGNVATRFGVALHDAGVAIRQVYSRSAEHAQMLATRLQCEAIADIAKLDAGANAPDFFIISVADDALVQIAEELCKLFTENGQRQPIVVHTAGSVAMGALHGFEKHGVVYPLQTLKRQHYIDMRSVPLYIEASEGCRKQVEQFANIISQHVDYGTSEQRRKLHLAAVIACNFTNHLYALTDELLSEEGIPFNILLPLIRETTNKLVHVSPAEAQTGPAARNDIGIMNKHLQLLIDNKHRDIAEIYRLLSQSIRAHSADSSNSENSIMEI